MGINGKYRPLVNPLSALWAIGLAAMPSNACDMALILAVDVSLSVDAEEYALQVQGTAAALMDQNVQAALLSGGGVALTMMQWSGRNDQHVAVPWQFVSNRATLEDLALQIQHAPRAFQSDTAPGSAIAFADLLHRTNPDSCARQVTDISGDGIENNGLRTRNASDQAVANGTTINGLVVLGHDDRVEQFYRYNVIGGPGSFVEIAQGYGDYERAIRDKLLKELPPMLSMGLDQ